MLSGSNMYFFPFKDRLNRELEMQNEVTIEEEDEMEKKIESNPMVNTWDSRLTDLFSNL